MSSVSPAKPNDLPLFNWLRNRSAGVLLHPTSLPGNQGIGTLEPGPIGRFLDFLHAAGMSQWQVCPLGPTGFGDSPYQCFSAFAGNPYLIDLNAFVTLGLLRDEELSTLRSMSQDHVEYGYLWENKWPLLARAHRRYVEKGRPDLPYGNFAAFRKANHAWLEDYAFFRALKDHHNGAAWWEWPAELRRHSTALKSSLHRRLSESIEAHAFYQFVFFGQWAALRAQAQKRGIQIIGDLPIFVALDSADAWSAPQLFEIDEATGRPTSVAGVPPDYFSADGQLWGNPLYRWDVHASDKFAWWRSRLAASFAQADIVRIDHFRAFDEYWRIPASAKTARTGEWTPGPGLAFFREVQKAFPDAKIIAEDLGDIGDSVHQLRDQSGLPGMAILQFAFGGKPTNIYLPHNLNANSVVYPGTHDNDTTLGWYATTDEKSRDHVRRYLRVSGAEVGWDFLRAAQASVSRMAVFPLQDLLSLGSEARLNTPGLAQGNWQWRYRQSALDALMGGTAKYLHELAELYGRLPAPAKPNATTGH
jgi:4-alpha-glucanotransferase